jgi:acetyl-CoA carboxylase carboxyl transferase subunit alpha
MSEAIARNVFEMSTLRTPIVSVVIGEGMSGGALAIGVCDRLLMLEYSTYAVITPEGCASILWKSAENNEEAAEGLNMTAVQLRNLGLVDEVLPEPLGGAHRNWPLASDLLREGIVRHLNRLQSLSPDQLVAQREAKIASFGSFTEKPG